MIEQVSDRCNVIEQVSDRCKVIEQVSNKEMQYHVQVEDNSLNKTKKCNMI